MKYLAEERMKPGIPCDGLIQDAENHLMSRDPPAIAGSVPLGAANYEIKVDLNKVFKPLNPYRMCRNRCE